jgi:hypothetical protein
LTASLQFLFRVKRVVDVQHISKRQGVVLFDLCLNLIFWWITAVKRFCVVSVIAAAFWIVIYSYYRQVDEEKSPNSGIVNYTYGVPDDRVQISSLEDGNALRPHAAKMVPDMA